MATLIEVIDREVTNPLLVAAENLELRQTGVYLENQATDRAYRIGQENKVNVYRLISKGTIEEKIIALQNQKKDLISEN